LYDKNWNPINYVWNPICAGIHDIELRNNSVWVTSSRNDLLICLDFNGNILQYYDIRNFHEINEHSAIKIKPFLDEDQILNSTINFRDPRTHDHSVTDMLHINSLAFLGNGDILLSCGLFRFVDDYLFHRINNTLKRSIFSQILPSVYRLYKRSFHKKEISSFEALPISNKSTHSLLLKITNQGVITPNIRIDHCKVPSHSVRILKDKSAIYLNSTSGELIHFDPEKGAIFSKTFVGKMFLRGARELIDGSILLGDNDYLIHFDMVKKQVLSRTNISPNSSEAVFDINILPEGFKLPPESFPELHMNNFPVVQRERKKTKKSR
jgi:uncharacterized membrane protein